MSKLITPPTHLFIPDTQHGPGKLDNHLWWAGQYVVDQFWGKQLRIIHAGDHADMQSLSGYDKGTRRIEGARYTQDIDSANHGWDVLNTPLEDANRRRSVANQWHPLSMDLTLGNHEDRITRATIFDPQNDAYSLDDLNYEAWGWTVHPFLEPVELDGVVYAHYFYNPNTGRPYSGENLKLRLKNIGHSFSMGHQQTFDAAIRFVNGRSQHGLVAGAYYLHDEDYKGPQGNAHWRGLVVCHQVENGSYDLMQVSLDYLCRRYEGMRLSEFKRRYCR